MGNSPFSSLFSDDPKPETTTTTTPSTDIDVRQLISACIDAARKSGDIAREVVMSGNLGVTEKTGPSDLLTIADGKVQSFIMNGLLKLWPNLTLIGEESVSASTENFEPLNIHELDNIKFNVNTTFNIDDLTLYIDPIDATKEFTEGLYSNVTVLIGIAHKSEPLAGVVFQPWSQDDKESPAGMLLWALEGHGLEGAKVDIKEPDLDKLIVTTTRSHLSERIVEGLKQLNPATLIKIGGCGYKILLVITGQADVYYYPSRGTNKWDTCGPEALVRAVNGRLTDIDGNNINYSRDQPTMNENGLLVTARKHNEILEKLKKSKI